MSSKSINKIAICGGGIGGLTLAAVLSKNSNIYVDIYEAKPTISTLGSAIAIWKRSWQVLQELELDAEMEKRGLRLPKDGESQGPIFRKADQPDVGFDFHSHIMPYGPTSIARPVLLEMLLALLSDRCTVHTSKTLTKYTLGISENEPRVTLSFSDGSTAPADVLVGADGVHSATRAEMYRTLAQREPSAKYEEFIEPIWSGTYAYRCTADLPKFKELYPSHQWCGRNKHVVSLPFGPIISVIGFVTVASEGSPYDGPWVSEVPAEELRSAFENWELDLVRVLENVAKPSRWAVHVVHTLPYFVDKYVVLLGDSAHAMTTHQGVGGGQAIEDAHILGHLLADPSATIDNLPTVLQIYEEIRKPVVTAAVTRSQENGLMYEFNHPQFPVSKDAKAEDLALLGSAVGASFAWLAEGGCAEDLARARSLLGDRLRDGFR